jgi:hypothetical protein
MTDITFAATIGGMNVPVYRFNITGGSYGSVGHLTLHCTQAALDAAKIDLFTLTSGSPGFTEVDLTVTQATQPSTPAGGYSTQQQPNTTETRIFGGEYITTEYDMDTDEVVVHARDWAGVLVDQKRVLTKIANAIQAAQRPLAPGRVSAAGISNENQKVGNIVASIANEFGFNPILNLSSGGLNPTVGTLYGSADQSFITVPQSMWTILNQLARDTGYDVYVTPKKDLVFGEPGAGLDTIQLSWNQAPGDGQIPCKNLKITHHPRRNSTFRVLVMSYDPSKAQTTLGRATYIGNNFAGQHGLSGGLSTGQAAVTADNNILALQQAGAKLGTTQIPLYSFNLDGLSADQANIKAQSIATDIAKRELILSAQIEGLPSLLPTQKITLTGKNLKTDFTGSTFYVSNYDHTFTLPSGGRGGSHDGWITKVTALNIPSEGLSKGDEG